jgi:AcrR family transcriptional regulator
MPQPEGKPTKDRILDAAFRILHKEGVKKLTQPEVAKVAGVRQSHLTYYFPRRADLVAAVVERFVTAARERFAALEQSNDTAALIETLARLMTDPVHMRLFLGFIVEADQDPALRAVLDGHVREFHVLVAAAFGREAEDPDVGILLDLLRGRGLMRMVSGDALRGDHAEIARRLGFTSGSSPRRHRNTT